MYMLNNNGSAMEPCGKKCRNLCYMHLVLQLTIDDHHNQKPWRDL